MEKHKPHYNLDKIKGAFSDPDNLGVMTSSARNGARALKLSDETEGRTTLGYFMNKCVTCGGGPVKRQTRQTSFKYNGQTLRYDQPGLWCDECGEVFLDKSDKEATDPLIYNFQAKLDGRLTTDDILRIRRKLGLTQKEAGELIGGGPNAFSRYENGKSYPSKGVENFLRVLDKHPEDIKELREEKAAA